MSARENAELNPELEDDDELDPPIDQETDEGADDAADIEARARAQGWIPEGEWDQARADKEGIRKPKEFLSAKDWLDRVGQNNSMLRERNRFMADETRKLANQVSEVNTKLADRDKKLDEMGRLVEDLHKSNKDAGKRGYEKARRELEAKQEAAVAEGDTETYKATKAQLKELEEEHAEEEAPPPATTERRTEPEKREVDPYVHTWVGENNWYSEDDELRGVATIIHGRLSRENPGWTIQKNLAEVKKEVMTRFPERFENERRRAPSSVNPPSGDRERNRGRGRTFDDLPQADKDAFERQAKYFKAKGSTYTKDEYLADYQWS